MERTDNTPRRERATAQRPSLDSPADRAPRRRRTLLRWTLTALVLLAVSGAIAWFLPAILVTGPWRDMVLGWMLADLNATVAADRVRLGWFSPVEVRGLKLRDSSGGPLLDLVQLRTEKSLLQLMWNWQQIGRLYLEQPTVHFVATSDTTNWEQALAEYLKPSSQPWPTVHLEVSGGTLHLVDRSAVATGKPVGNLSGGAKPPPPGSAPEQWSDPIGPSREPAATPGESNSPEQTWSMEQVELSAEIRGGPSPEILVQASAAIGHRSHQGHLRASYAFGAAMPVLLSSSQGVGEGAKQAQPETVAAPATPGAATLGSQYRQEASPVAGADGAAGAAQSLEVIADGFPLGALRPLLARTGWRVDLRGTVSGNLLCDWRSEGDRPGLHLKTRISGGQVEVSGDLLAGDRLAFDRLDVGGGLVWQNGRVELTECFCRSGANSVSASGTILTAALTWPPAIDLLAAEPLAIGGELDLAQLADQLPGLLRIRKDAQIQSGRLQFACANRLADNKPGWSVEVQMDYLRAQAAGKPLVWEKPAGIQWTARPGGLGEMQHSLVFWSDFLNVQAAGLARNASGSARFHLEQLTEQFGQLIDFGKFQLAGTGWMQFRCEQPQADRFVCDSRLHVDHWRLTMPDGRTWAEPQLSVTANLEAAAEQGAHAGREGPATAFADDLAALVTHSAAATVQAGNDQVTMRLAEPVPLGRLLQQLALRAESSGRLESWVARAAPFVQIAPWQVAGAYQASATVRIAGEAVEVEQASVQASNLHVSGPGVQLREPQAGLVFSGRWQWSPPAAELRNLRLTGAALGAAAESIVWNPQDQQLGGRVEFGADLAQLASWLNDPQQDGPGLQLAGTCSGSVQFANNPQVGRLSLDAAAQNVQWRTSGGQTIREPSVQTLARLVRSAGANRWTIEQMELRCNSFAGAATGWVDLDRQPIGCELQGRALYDWGRVEPLLHLYVPRGVSLQGTQEGTFRWFGPLDAAQATGSLAAGWQSGDIYGLPLGPAQMRLALGEGVLQLEPMEVAVAEGRARLAASMRLDTAARQLEVQSGRVLDQVRINPSMCAAAIGFVAPPLAGVTRAEGSFSLELDECSIPIGQPEKGRLEGRLLIHSVEVSTGPLLQALAQVMGRSATARLRSESIVPFHLADGRVHHRNLELVFPEVTIRTWGSVGLDQSLALTVEMPVPPKLRTGRPVVDAVLRDQKVQLPVAGTLFRPKLDERALARVVEQAVEQALRNVLQGQVPGLLDELMRLPRQ